MANYEFSWINKRRQRWYWYTNIFDSLGRYYNEFIKKLAQIPFYYSERAIVGHIAMAAYRCGYHYSLQDYTVKTEKGCRYPDLWITLEPKIEKYDTLFEVKKEIMSIDFQKDTLNNLFGDRALGIHEKYEPISRNEYVKCQCALVVIRIYYSGKWWVNNTKDRNTYNRVFRQFKTRIDDYDWSSNSDKPDFRFLYKIPYRNVVGNLKLDGWNDMADPLLGLLILGSFKPVN